MIKKKYFYENFILPIGDFLLGQSFIKNLKRLRKEVSSSGEELRILQNKRLGEILNYAISKSDYYSNLNITLTNNPELDLQKFPILDKLILYDQQNSLLTTSKRKLLRQCSSGSSGFQSIVFWSKLEQSIHRATQILWWEWAGYKFGNPILQTGMTPQRGFVKSIKDKLLNTYYFVAFVSTNDNFIKALKWASKKRKVFLGGYASSLYVLSKQALENKYDVSFDGAVSWGDKLFDHYRSSINSVFKTQLHETYGTAEGMMIAAQKDLEFMYIMSPNVYLEILDDNGNVVPDGLMGNVVVTSLVAKSMPLIRYKIGDLAIKLPKSEYPVKRDLQLPLLKKVIGRDTDIVKTPSGKFMVVHTFTGIFEHFTEIEQFCIVQHNIESIEILYIPREIFKISILHSIEDLIQKYLEEPSFKIFFKEVECIPPTPSGKPQIIISNISK